MITCGGYRDNNEIYHFAKATRIQRSNDLHLLFEGILCMEMNRVGCLAIDRYLSIRLAVANSNYESCFNLAIRNSINL